MNNSKKVLFNYEYITISSRRHFIKNSLLLSLAPTFPAFSGELKKHSVSRKDNYKISIIENYYRYNGIAEDISIGQQHLGDGFRVYSSKLMRFNGLDSQSPFNFGGVNAYIYAVCEPLNNIDKNGRTPFKIGDLVYGLKQSRLDFFASNNIDMKINNGLTIDSYVATGTGFRAMMNNGFDNYPPQQGRFTRFINSSSKYRGLLKVEGRLDKRGELFFPIDEAIYVRRKCKAGLAWAAKDKIEVHFVLDGIDLNSTTLKSGYNGRSYTSSELRWIYRNWNDQSVKKSIQFHENGKQVPAPWETEQGNLLWRKYIPKKII